MYGVVICARNEENNIRNLVNSLMRQSIKPESIIIVNDGSTDKTLNVCNSLKKNCSVLNVYTLNNKRYKVKGYNISLSANYGIKKMLELKPDIPYILKCDADVILWNPRYNEMIIREMEKDKRVGLSSGYSNYAQWSKRHITDGARMYKVECLKDVLNKISPNEGYPIMYGHDSFMITATRYCGWKLAPLHLTYKDVRPYYRDKQRSFLSGRFHYMNGYPFLHELRGLISRVYRRRTMRFNTLLMFISFLVFRLTKNNRRYDKGYLKFQKHFWSRLSIRFYKKMGKKLLLN